MYALAFLNVHMITGIVYPADVKNQLFKWL